MAMGKKYRNSDKKCSKIKFQTVFFLRKKYTFMEWTLKM